MKTYIYCILLSMLLVGGIQSVFSTNQQELRTEVGDVNIQSYLKASCCVSMAVANQSSSTSSHSFNDRVATSNINESFSGGFSASRTSVPYKTLRFNAMGIVMQLLSYMDSSLSNHIGRDSLSAANFTKYTNRYYVYTLKRILI